ncbi:MAG: pimeloyl-CoA dehydrogenase small subunit [Gammaproteobacteria bacterium]|nr:MAG: pimeloyl-CoA dehydrogenase small subunit [Gammaproteobacteria bacterium]
MDFSLNEDQALLKDSLERFIQGSYDFDTRRANVASELGYSRETYAQFAELGWTAVPFSEADGGLDGGPIELMVMMEQFGRGLVIEPYFASIVLAGAALRHAGDDDAKARWLAGLIDGSLTGALALQEPQSRFDLANVRTRAERSDEGWRLTGHKAVVLNARDADVILVPARTRGRDRDRDGITLFALAAGTPGMTTRAYPTVDGMQAAEVILEDVQLPADAVLGHEDGALAVLEAVTREALLAVCAEAVGIMAVLVEKTVDYSKNRKQFGLPIGAFQALQHRMVEMFMEHEQTRSLLYMAAMKLAAGAPDVDRALSALKYQVGRSGRRIGQEAVQLHGGMGVTHELDVAHYFKRLTMIDLAYGNADHHLSRFAA